MAVKNVTVGDVLKTTDGKTTKVCGYFVNDEGVDLRKIQKIVDQPAGHHRFYAFADIVKKGGKNEIESSDRSESIWWGT